MQPAIACAPAGEPAAVLLADYATHLTRTSRGNAGYQRAARAFLRRWPDPQSWAALPLAERLAACGQTRPFLVFLMVTGRLHTTTWWRASWPAYGEKFRPARSPVTWTNLAALQANSATPRQCGGAWPPRCWSGF